MKILLETIAIKNEPDTITLIMDANMITEIFQYIKADQFFANYLPHIKNYKRKISGKNGKGQPLAFTDQEVEQVKQAVKNLLSDLSK
jgi:hypothetical protein